MLWFMIIQFTKQYDEIESAYSGSNELVFSLPVFFCTKKEKR